MRKGKLANYCGEVVFLGIDVHKKSWQLLAKSSVEELKVSQPADVNRLYKWLTTSFPGALFQSAYESGFSGCGLHRSLISLGIDNRIVHAADIPRSDKGQRRKSDKLDARTIAQYLSQGILKGIYVPSIEAEELRQLVRRRSQLVRDISRQKNRIKSMLDFSGYSLEDFGGKQHWNESFLLWISNLAFATEAGARNRDAALEELRDLERLRKKVDKQLLVLSKEAQHQETLSLLRSIPGIGTVGSWVLYSELIDIHRFANFDELCGYVGLVPDQRSSGSKTVVGQMTNRGNTHIKAILIECAWRAAVVSPHFKKLQHQYAQRMNANKAIVRVAKRLLSVLYAVWRKQIPYQEAKTRNEHKGAAGSSPGQS